MNFTMITSSSLTSYNPNASYLNSNSPTPILNFTMITSSSLTSSNPNTSYHRLVQPNPTLGPCPAPH